MRDIKTKTKMQAIKTKDTKGNIKHFIKQQTIHTKSKDVDKKENASVKSNPQVQAVNKVSVAAKQTVVESKHRATKFIKQKRNEYKIKSTSKKSIIESSHDIQPQRISYISKAKKHVVNKVNVSKIKQTTEQIVSKPIVQNATQAIKKSFHIVKKSVSTLNTLFSFGTGLILLIVITLFIGTFSVLAQDGGSNSEIVSLSEEVIAYEDTIRKYAKEYDIEEEDFLSAELEAVPAGPARDYGIDRSMIMGYGHDDRVCAFPSLIALINSSEVKRTGVCILVDKEEIGSVGATGMQSRFFENMVAEVMDRCGNYSELGLRRALANSYMLSSDVSAAYDPNYASVFEKKNAAYFGKGMVFNKYTGARGKSGSNDASAEFVGKLRKVMDDADVSFQTAELGKVDIGGGGTIAYILANLDMNVIDSGIAVQNMHAPYEVISKADLYETLKGYEAFLKNA